MGPDPLLTILGQHVPVFLFDFVGEWPHFGQHLVAQADQLINLKLLGLHFGLYVYQLLHQLLVVVMLLLQLLLELGHPRLQGLDLLH